MSTDELKLSKLRSIDLSLKVIAWALIVIILNIFDIGDSARFFMHVFYNLISQYWYIICAIGLFIAAGYGLYSIISYRRYN